MKGGSHLEAQSRIQTRAVVMSYFSATEMSSKIPQLSEEGQERQKLRDWK